MDVILNGDNGLDICQAIKESSFTKHIKIVMMTASNAFSKVERETYLADYYISKPFDINEIAAMAKQLIGK